MFLRAVLITSFVAAGAARAEEAKPAQRGPSPAPAAAPQASGMSQSKFLGVLYAEIAKRTPQETAAGPGEVSASFHISASGKIDKVTIVKSTSAAHSEIVKNILTDLQAPPPPGGADDISQTFKFH